MPYAGAAATRFVTYEFVDFWPELVTAIDELETRLRLHGRPVAADTLLRSFSALYEELLLLGRTMAVVATDELVKEEKATRVRADTEGDGGKRLETYLKAEAIEQRIMPGAIGIADKELLDNNVPWWVTNELGSSARVGGRLFGFFSGGGDLSPPDSTQFREHPLFTVGGAGDPVSGVGYIENPIPERRFIKKAQPKIAAEWYARFSAIKGRFDNELARVLAMPR